MDEAPIFDDDAVALQPMTRAKSAPSLEVREERVTHEAAALAPAPEPVPPAPSIEPPPSLEIPGYAGDWPSLAAELPLRGVVQQLALQSELWRCQGGEGAIDMHLRLPVDTLRSAGSPEKLSAALSEKLGRRVNLTTEVGPVSRTASSIASAQREQRQREAEQAVNDDPFVQTLMREFGAVVVPGSVRVQ